MSSSDVRRFSLRCKIRGAFDLGELSHFSGAGISLLCISMRLPSRRRPVN